MRQDLARGHVHITGAISVRHILPGLALSREQREMQMLWLREGTAADKAWVSLIGHLRPATLGVG